MLSVEQCKKILGDKAKNYTDEKIEAIRDQLYILANLAFGHWQKNCSSAKEEEVPSSFVGAQLTSPQLHAGDSTDVN
ncbi:MAG TPA: hypothetical protein P5524_00485 [Candidatus Paceibacterota bacterium]|nr:hypothetical protein [Candidatus Paceibacterota bacterium]